MASPAPPTDAGPAAAVAADAAAADAVTADAVAAEAPLTWRQRIRCRLGAYALYSFNVLSHYGRRFKWLFAKPAKAASLIKTYPCRPSLRVHVHYPPSYDKAAQQKLPTLLTIHGGGFVIGNPEDSDAWDYDFVRHKEPVLAVELNYRKGPFWPFPTAVYDVEALVQAVLADETLPIDRSRVAIAGWSAGGNLALAAAALPSLRGRIHAAVPMYPVVNFAIPTADKIRRRQYKPALDGFRARKVDFLLPLASVFNWAYLPSPSSADTTDPRLSPAFAPKESLPPYVFLLAAELDMLSHESWQLASRLAGRSAPPAAEPTGSSEIHPPGQLVLDDERFSFEARTDASSYKWLLVPDTIHGFDMRLVEYFKNDDIVDDAQRKRTLCMTMIHDWLFSGPFKA